MNAKKSKPRRRVAKGKTSRGLTHASRVRRGITPKMLEREKVGQVIRVVPQSTDRPEPPSPQRFRISIEDISGNTPIGDLLVAFPRTRDVLMKRGLRMEAEHAGQIYMTVEAFSALTEQNVRSFIQELVEAARTPLPLTSAESAAAPLS